MSNEKNACNCPFCNQEVEPADGLTAKERLVQSILTLAKEMQERNSLHYCQRCGKDSMTDRNAVSRAFTVNICPDCGTDETLRAMNGNDLPVVEWAMVKEIMNYGDKCPQEEARA